MIKGLGAIILLTVATCIGVWLLAGTHARAESSGPPTPILVELFTSEGCSSCPLADALLAKLDQSQPVAGAELIVLSEHVDYWNYIGWTDPFSSSFYSNRQNSYAQRFGRDGVYTPEMVVDGSREFLGSDAGAADRAFAQALKTPKIGMQLSGLSLEGLDLKAHVATEVLPASYVVPESDVYLVITLSHAESNVSRGENSGRKLSHAGVVKSLMKIGTLQQGHSFSRDVQMKLENESDPRNLRVVAFIQEPNTGRVLGATMQPLSK